MPVSESAGANQDRTSQRDLTTLRIDRAEWFGISLKQFRPFKTSFGYIGEHHLFLKVTTNDGVTGWGETGHFLPPFTGESWESALAHTELLSSALIGRNPLDRTSIGIDLDRRLHGNYQVKCAIDFALHDIAANAMGVPFNQLFGGATVDRVEAQMDVAIGNDDAVVQDVQRAVDFGIRSVGLKVGQPGSPSVEDDIRRVRTVRREFPNLELSIDCNAGYSRSEAVRAIRGFEAFDVTWVEQPVGRWDLEGMAYVAERVNTPIAADESVWIAQQVHAIARLGAAQIVHAKIPKAGGFWPTQQLGIVCESLGLPVTIASFAFGDFGQAALVHFVAAHPGMQIYKAKLRGGGLSFPEDVVHTRLELESGSVAVPRGPGIGVQINEEEVRKLAFAYRDFAERSV